MVLKGEQSSSSLKGGLRELALFAGAGGGILAGKLLGWRTVCAVESAPFPRRVLLARQKDGLLERFPVWDDVRTFDGKPWAGNVDIITGGFPCQNISSAGNAAGIKGKKSGLWQEMARIIREVRPRFVFLENTPMLTTRGIQFVLGDLAQMGFDAKWGVLGARHSGAPHKRDRIWIVAHTSLERLLLAKGKVSPGWNGAVNSDWWCSEPRLGRVADGVANRVDRIRAIGNGQVPAVAALAWHLLSDVHR